MYRIVYSDIHWLHQDPYGHPENPERIEIALNALRRNGLINHFEKADLTQRDDSVYLVHSREYVEWIRNECMKGFHYIDSDTYVTKDTYRVASSFSSATGKAVLQAVKNREIWFIMPRPPGHHAGFNGIAMRAPTLGFCIFNHVAVAAKTILEINDSSRVLIIDFDAHHGNGTQEIFWSERRVVHVDIHEAGIYPGTGSVDDIGGGDGVGSKINIPLEPYTGDEVYLWILEKIIKPLVEKYKFKAILVSAGFDSYIGDPLTELNATDKTFYLYGSTLRMFHAEKYTEAIIAVLEGGYGAGLKNGLTSFIKGLLGLKESVNYKIKPPSRRVYESLKKTMYNYHGIDID